MYSTRVVQGESHDAMCAPNDMKMHKYEVLEFNNLM
uniref:Uncharacterized protein n=1 Tax=Arundo donax TaxID=35708 RepID=A0A0A9GM50_ARUDO